MTRLSEENKAERFWSRKTGDVSAKAWRSIGEDSSWNRTVLGEVSQWEWRKNVSANGRCPSSEQGRGLQGPCPEGRVGGQPEQH